MRSNIEKSNSDSKYFTTKAQNLKLNRWPHFRLRLNNIQVIKQAFRLDLNDYGVYRDGALVLMPNAVSPHPFQFLYNQRPN
jgi:hypothetical protein